MKRALLLFAMFAFLGTAYTASAAVANTAGIYCDNCKGGGHKHDDNCRKDCKKDKSKKGCYKGKASASKKGCCAKSSSTVKKSCGYKSGAKASAATNDKSNEDK